MRFLPLLVWVTVNILYCTASLAGNQQSRLDRIVVQIKNIKNVLQQTHNKRDQLQEDLNKIETNYGEASQNRRRTDQQILHQKQQITALERASRHNLNQTQWQQNALAEQLRMAYLLQRQGPVKLLLNQRDLSETDRLLYYYHSLTLYRLNAIKKLGLDMEQINNRQRQLYAQYDVLKHLQQQQQSEEKNLTLMKANRTQLIMAINQHISDAKQRLDALSRNKQRLEKMLIHLAHIPIAPKPRHFSNQNFAAQHGHLPWPTRGSVLHYFNTPIANSELKWNGEIIEAPDEQPVYTVAGGTVVFSKWLEGYGLLIIINHGDGYMTLYGRNHSIYKHEGDKVSAGDLIATVGQSGGYDKPALYFAIRYNAKPLDPHQWCT